ncbi:hypothetical protein KCU85_g8, partial [Aureobasidium melanogenum]
LFKRDTLRCSRTRDISVGMLEPLPQGLLGLHDIDEVLLNLLEELERRACFPTHELQNRFCEILHLLALKHVCVANTLQCLGLNVKVLEENNDRLCLLCCRSRRCCGLAIPDRLAVLTTSGLFDEKTERCCSC